ncbi:MAG: M81 family metallopeptidase, partial [Gammaproteobacteria bacterium]|nr:M81 family metallopeptidase [Gammaproteobacteria bacterium]
MSAVSFLQKKSISVFLLLAVLILSWMLLNQPENEENKPARIAVATFMHETCTFCPNPTTIEDWEFYGPPTADILNGGNGYINGFVKMANDISGIELVGITSPRRSRGGSSGSWI